jgi:hypothetical protein
MTVAIRGPRTSGPMAPELPIRYARERTGVPLTVLSGNGSPPLRKSS